MKNYTENDIRTAAYYNWLNSGCQNGNDLQNWNNALLQLSGTCNTGCACKKATVKKTTTKKLSIKKLVSSKSKK